MPDEKPQLSPEEIADFVRHKLANEEAPRLLLRQVVDKRICEFVGISFDPKDETHVPQLQALWSYVRRAKTAQDVADALALAAIEARKERRRGLAKTVREKIVSVLTGILIATGMAWLSAKLGFKIPGVTE